MSFVPAKCCNCGANLQVNDDKDAAICSACGTPFVVEKAINYFISGNNYRSDYKIVAGVLKKYYGSSVDISIPEGVIEIGSYAFKGSSHLSNNDRKKELLIIYDSKDEDVFKHISSLIMSEDDIDSEVVGLKDDSVIVYKCCFADYTKQKNMADKFLFVDCIPKNSNEKQLFSKYGISYGTIDDNKIYIKTDKAFSFDKDAYDSFLAELKSLADVPISEVNAYKKTEKIKSRSALNKGLRIASLAVAPTVGVALHIIDAGNETQARAMRRKQMLYYGLTRLYLDDLNTLIHD